MGRSVDVVCDHCGVTFSKRLIDVKRTPRNFCSRRCVHAQVFDEQPRSYFNASRKNIGPSGCWEWAGAKNEDGYGISRFGGVQMGAHRVAWTLKNGDIPEGMQILHTCDNRGCVNPEHLRLGTHLDNMRDMWGKGRNRNARVLSSWRPLPPPSEVTK